MEVNNSNNNIEDFKIEKLEDEISRDNNFLKIYDKKLKEIKPTILTPYSLPPIDKPMVLVVSDVHLGACWSFYEEFIEFLKEIYEKKTEFKNIGAIIINGDFFDLCADSYKNLSQRHKYRIIYDFLNKISNQDIPIIFTLGNHEIPITGNYERWFSWRKKKFIRKFRKELKKENFDITFLKREHFCQYIILQIAKKGEHKGKWELVLYDSKKDILNRENSIEIVPLKRHFADYNIDHNYKFLFAHGYQFDLELHRKIAAPIWKFCINSPRFLKNFITDGLWNNFIKPGLKSEILGKIYDIDEKEIEDFFDKNDIYNFIEQIWGKKLKKRHKKKLINLIISIKESDRLRGEAENEIRYNESLNFLVEDELSDINHVIFGHTHEPGKETKFGHYLAYLKIKKHKKKRAIFITKSFNMRILFANSGGWQKAVNPSYIEIYKNANLEVKTYPAKNVLNKAIITKVKKEKEEKFILL